MAESGANHRQSDGSKPPALVRELCAARVPPGAYFDAVAEAIEAAGIALGDWYRDEDRAAIYEIDPCDVDRGPLAAIASRGLFVGWLRPELGSIAGLAAAGGWFLVPCTKLHSPVPEVRPLPALACLAEPADVAGAVRGIVLGEEPGPARPDPGTQESPVRPRCRLERLNRDDGQSGASHSSSGSNPPCSNSKWKQT
jgi:hypothetical protein